MKTKKELEKEVEVLQREIEYLWQEHQQIMDENGKLAEENTIMDDEFNILARENDILKEALAAVFRCDKEWLTQWLERLKDEWHVEQIDADAYLP